MELDIRKVSENVYLVDLNPPIEEFENFIASYIVIGDQVAIIETGPSSSIGTLLKALESLSIDFSKVSYVALTHIHIDHGGGSGKLLRDLPNARLVTHEVGAPHMANPRRLTESTVKVLGELAKKYGEIEPVPADRIIVGRDGLTLNLGGGVELEVLEAPGHAPHHLCFFNRKTGELWLGEAGGVYLEDLGILRPSTPAPGFDYAKNLETIDKLLALNPKTLYYTHFGVANNPENLKIYKEKLNMWLRIVSEGYQENRSPEEILQRIVGEDPELEKLLTIKREKFFLLSNINGIIHYLRKRETRK